MFCQLFFAIIILILLLLLLLKHAIIKMSDMTGSSGSPSQSIHSGDIHLSPHHCLSDMTSINSLINDHSLHERSYIQCKFVVLIM